VRFARVLIALAALAPVLSGCGGAGAWLAGEPGDPGARRLQGATAGPVGQGTWAGEISLATRPTFIVARTAAEWQALWDLVGQPVPGALPEDLMAMAVFIGTRTTGGYAVHVTDVRLERRPGIRDRVLVEYREVEPGRDARTAQILTSPYAIVLVPRTSSNVRFARAEERRLYE